MDSGDEHNKEGEILEYNLEEELKWVTNIMIMMRAF